MNRGRSDNLIYDRYGSASPRLSAPDNTASAY
nr:MAG TPA_asm: hypothetical protein [Caudoviricetes sp.]